MRIRVYCHLIVLGQTLTVSLDALHGDEARTNFAFVNDTKSSLTLWYETTYCTLLEVDATGTVPRLL